MEAFLSQVVALTLSTRRVAADSGAGATREDARAREDARTAAESGRPTDGRAHS